MIAFCIPFLVTGVIALTAAGYQIWQGKPVFPAAMLFVFGLVFAGVAIMFMTVAIKGSAEHAERERLRAREADRPWLWRKEWAEGVMLDQSSATGWFFLFFGIFWNCVSVPIAFLMWRDPSVDSWKLMLGMIFPLIGAFLLIAAVHQLLRRKRFGLSRCRLDRIPIVPGRTFSGSIEAKIFDAPPDGFLMRLACVRRITTGSGKNRSTNENLLWQEEQTVSGARGMPSPNGMRIPFSFTLPRDVEPSDENESNDQVVWRLYVSAEMPGIDYASQFELPVFRTASFGEEEESAPETRPFTAHDAAMAVATPSQKSRIALSRLPSGGEEIRVGLPPPFGEIFLFVLITVAWWAATVALLMKNAPVCFPIVFVLCGILLVVSGIDKYLGRSTIQADRRGLTVRRTWLGAGKPRFHPREQIEAITSSIGSSTGNGAGSVYYSVSAKLRGGKSAAVARYIRGKRDAEIVAARVGRALGL